MASNVFTDKNRPFSNEEVLIQMGKILNYKLFYASVCLSKFLKFIVNETLSERSHNIKEYTIAVCVFNKPYNFKTNHDCMVRVHARRLRIALDSYYNEKGMDDECKITIPTGRYIPVFELNNFVKLSPESCLNSSGQFQQIKEVKIACMPFNSYETVSSKLGLVDNIGLQLSTEFVNLENFVTLCYYTARQQKGKNRSLKSIYSQYGIQYFLLGSVGFESSQLRVSVQLVDAVTEIQLWAQSFFIETGTSGLYELEKLACSKIIDLLSQFKGWAGYQLMRNTRKHELEICNSLNVPKLHKLKTYKFGESHTVRRAIF
jgi:TolB-like protein